MSTDNLTDASNDPQPQPPSEPQEGECCGNGCVPCVYDLYWEAVEKYETALGEWQARQTAKQS